MEGVRPLQKILPLLELAWRPLQTVYYDFCKRSILVSAGARPPDFMNKGSMGAIIRRGSWLAGRSMLEVKSEGCQVIKPGAARPGFKQLSSRAKRHGGRAHAKDPCRGR